MMHAGIFTGYYPYGLKETAKTIQSHGMTTVQLDLHFKDVDLSAGQITAAKAKLVRDTFRDHNLPICCISGYTNIIHPDKDERARRVGYLKEIIRNARAFGTPYVISETGTYNTELRLGPPPEEQDRRGFRGMPQGHRGSGADRL